MKSKLCLGQCEAIKASGQEDNTVKVCVLKLPQESGGWIGHGSRLKGKRAVTGQGGGHRAMPVQTHSFSQAELIKQLQPSGMEGQ
jgi:hypothetical protein